MIIYEWMNEYMNISTLQLAIAYSTLQTSLARDLSGPRPSEKNNEDAGLSLI
jgi:hypothetical protein